MALRLCVLCFLMGISAGALAQGSQDYTGNWFMANGINRLHNRWSVHTEFQWRMFRTTSDVEQMLARTGINYHLTRDITFTGGYAYIGNYAFGEDDNTRISQENRAWQQVNLRHDMNHLVIESRLRIEQRWIGDRYLDRIRHRVLLSYRLNGHKKLVRRAWSAILSDEIFIHATGNPSFDRNRLYLAIGCHVIPELQFQAGYLRQAVPGFSKNHLQFGVFWNLDFRKKAG